MSDLHAEFARITARWAEKPVDFVCEALGVQPEPWQCDVLDTYQQTSRVAVRAGEEAGKTTVAAWAALHALYTREMAQVRVATPNAALTSTLWQHITRWTVPLLDRAPWLATQFIANEQTLTHRAHGDLWCLRVLVDPLELDSVQHVTLVLDEGQGVDAAVWERVRQRDDLRVLSVSLPGAHDDRGQRWEHLFVVHPEALRETLKREPAEPYSTNGTYYTSRHDSLTSRPECPAYTARVVGDVPDDDGTIALPYGLLADADTRWAGMPGDAWVAIAVANVPKQGLAGADPAAPVAFVVAQGGTLLHIETATVDHTDRRVSVDALSKAADALRARFKARGVLTNDERFNTRYRVNHNASEGYFVDLDGLRNPRNPVRASKSAEIAAKYTDVRSKLVQDVRDLLQDGHIAFGRLPTLARRDLLWALSAARVETDQVNRRAVRESGVLTDAVCLLSTRLVSQAIAVLDGRKPKPKEHHRFIEHVRYWDALETKLRQRWPVERALRWYREQYPGEYVPSDNAIHRYLRDKPERYFVRTLRRRPADEPPMPYLNPLEEHVAMIEALKERIARAMEYEPEDELSPELRQNFMLLNDAIKAHMSMCQQYGIVPIVSPTQRVRIDERAERHIFHHAYAHLNEDEAKRLHLLEEKVDRGEIDPIELYRSVGEVFRREQQAAQRNALGAGDHSGER